VARDDPGARSSLLSGGYVSRPRLLVARPAPRLLQNPHESSQDSTKHERIPDDSREEDERQEERRLRHLRGRVKAARAAVATTR
jgi:hypothetical protein